MWNDHGFRGIVSWSWQAGGIACDREKRLIVHYRVDLNSAEHCGANYKTLHKAIDGSKQQLHTNDICVIGLHDQLSETIIEPWIYICL